MKKKQDYKGRAAYASSAAETVFYRRSPEQLQSTLAFMLGKDGGRHFKFQAAELKPLRECLLWLRENNVHVKVYLTTYERFQNKLSEIQTVVPQGSTDARVRMQRKHRVRNTAESTTLANILGSESCVLVVVDPVDLPKTWKTVDLLAEKIGEAQYRGTPESAEGKSAVTLSFDSARDLQSSAQSLRTLA